MACRYWSMNYIWANFQPLSEIIEKTDVVVLGGGLAGLTLALQIKNERPSTSIVVLEKRVDDAPMAAHKVGESTVELGTHYLREVLGLRDYLDQHQLPKHGLRFFFSPKYKHDITRRVELGPRERPPVPSHQLDRGTLENDLIRFNREKGNDIRLDATVRDVELKKGDHRVTFRNGGKTVEIQAKWVIDATGRREFLKRKLKFQKEMDHDVNAVWFRFSEIIDVDDFSDDQQWRSKLNPGMRRLSTVHLMDRGYWVWLIPLVTDSTSVGIVADANIHNLEEFRSFESAMEWLHRNEPVCAQVLESHRDRLLDFKILKHYAHDSGRFYASEGWAVTGESGAFLDPFYSPGTDFISFANTWITDLVCSELKGENIDVKALAYEEMHNAFLKNWLPIYQNKYQLFGNTQVMVTKIFWDWATYWGVSTLLFTNKGITKLNVIKQLFLKKGAVLKKLSELNGKMQQLFLDWGMRDDPSLVDKYLDPLEIGYLNKFHLALVEMHSDEELVNVLRLNMERLETIAAEIFRRTSHVLNGTPRDMKVDPYQINLNKKAAGIQEDHVNGIGIDQEISRDVDYFWFYETTEINA